MRLLRKKSWFLKAILIVSAGELLVGIWKIAGWYWVTYRLWGGEFYISYWTLSRPWVFLILWILLYISFNFWLKGKKALLLIAGIWITMFGCYAVSWSDIYGSVMAYMQEPPLFKPFISYLFGFNEWDAIRLIFIVILFCYWLYHLKWKPGRNASARLAVD